jgi:hypothetical protein
MELNRAVSRGGHGVCAVWPKTTADGRRRRLGQGGCDPWRAELRSQAPWV